ncbi:MAG: hypothetical protein KBC84_05505 [Proteobacteria bacterium]|nr:hypothetical protein [Pseudomonadota bacterium]
MSFGNSKEIELLWEGIEEGANNIIKTIKQFRDRVAYIEQQVVINMKPVVSNGTKNLSTAIRILNALEARLEQINDILANANENSFKQAFTICRSKLALPNDSVNKLLTEETIAPIELSAINTILEELLSNVLLDESMRRTRMYAKIN